MALDDVKHVEAVALIERLLETIQSTGAETVDPDACSAAGIWLQVNHPPPSAYMAAMRSLAADG